MTDNSASGRRPAQDRLSSRFAARQAKLSPKLRLVAAFFEHDRLEALNSTAIEIGRRLGVSDATVVRTARALGFSGLPEVKAIIADTLVGKRTHAGNLQRALDAAQADIARAIGLVLDHETQLIAQLAGEDQRRAIADAVGRLHGARRIAIFGTGNSGLLANYVSRLLSRHGRATLALDASGIDLAEQLIGFGRGDALLMLFFGQPYAEAELVLEQAGAARAPVVMVTENARNPLSGHAEVVIEIRRTGPDGSPLHAATLACLEAIIMGLAATATEAALDTLDRLQGLRDRIRKMGML